MNETIVSLAAQLGRQLAARGLMAATAESCTGGLLAGSLIDRENGLGHGVRRRRVSALKPGGLSAIQPRNRRTSTCCTPSDPLLF